MSLIKHLPQIIEAFEEWYFNDAHSKNIDIYKDILVKNKIESLTKDQFIDLFYKFVEDGGKIQSGGDRTKYKFKDFIKDNFEPFKKFILEPFDGKFDFKKWFNRIKNYKYFGVGIATIYLNRIDKYKYSVFNNKTLDALILLGYSITKVQNLNNYYEVNRIQRDLILSYSSLNNLYKTDALNHFIIGTEEGKKLISDIQMDKVIGSVWSVDEVSYIIRDYFSMLEKEINGETYNKTEYRKKIITKLSNRSEGSIELKHQNISAVLIELGYPYIDGYKPRKNYQKMLYDMIVDYINDNRDIANRLSKYAEDPVDDEVYDGDNIQYKVDPPELTDDIMDKENDKKKFTGRKANYIKKEYENSRLGKAGEKFILEIEKNKLKNADRNDLAEKVEWTSDVKGDGTGYDILSYDTNGNEIYIEVKTTKLGKYSKFYISSNEIEFSKLNPDNYYLYRVFNFRKDKKYYILEGSLSKERLHINPILYEAFF